MYVNAFQEPPSREIALSSRLAGNCSVPLNCICSTQCETPVRPCTSSREPTRYQTHDEMIGAVWISLSRTLSPLESVSWVRVSIMERQALSKPGLQSKDIPGHHSSLHLVQRGNTTV